MILTIIIVNYRTAGLAIDCLASLAAERRRLPPTDVVVVDSASEDGSVSALADAIGQRGWARWVTLLPLPRNRGFAAGNNAGIGLALARPQPPDYLMMLNPDTVVYPGALVRLLDFLHRHPQAGMAGPRVEFADGTVQVSAFRFPSILGEWEGALRIGLMTRLLSRWRVAPPPAQSDHAADWLSGCALMIRRQALEELGPLDERYFMYFEEVDLCLRAARRGWERWYIPGARIVHHVGQASGVTDRTRRQPAYWFASRRHFFIKNHGSVYATLASVAFVLGFAGWRLRRWMLRIPDGDPPHMLWDFLRHTFRAPTPAEF